MIISPGRNYIFVHIPKTGGTSMALALEARAMADDILIGDTPKARKRRGRAAKLAAPGRLWKHSRLSDVDGMAELPQDPFVFTLVRNPWDRIASLYHWSRLQGFDHPLVAAAKDMSFRDFVLSRQIAAASRRDSAQDYVTDRGGRMRCNAFIRIEDLRQDIEPLEAHLGFALKLPHANRSRHPPAWNLYDTESQTRIAELFAADIDRFGYSFPAP